MADRRQSLPPLQSKGGVVVEPPQSHKTIWQVEATLSWEKRVLPGVNSKNGVPVLQIETESGGILEEFEGRRFKRALSLPEKTPTNETATPKLLTSYSSPGRPQRGGSLDTGTQFSSIGGANAVCSNGSPLNPISPRKISPKMPLLSLTVPLPQEFQKLSPRYDTATNYSQYKQVEKRKLSMDAQLSPVVSRDPMRVANPMPKRHSSSEIGQVGAALHNLVISIEETPSTRLTAPLPSEYTPNGNWNISKGKAPPDAKQNPSNGKAKLASTAMNVVDEEMIDSFLNAFRSKHSNKANQDYNYDFTNDYSQPLGKLKLSTTKRNFRDDDVKNNKMPPISKYQTEYHSIDEDNDQEGRVTDISSSGLALNLKAIKLTSFLGGRGFMQVYLGQDSAKNKVVMKVVSIGGDLEQQNLEQLVSLRQEAAVMKNLNHENIVQYYGMVEDSYTLKVFEEYVPGSSIFTILSKLGPLKEHLVQRYTRQILLGLEYLHSCRIVHGNIKCANMLLANSEVVKISNFGISYLMTPLATSSSKQLNRAPYWMAPEVIMQTPSSDGRQGDIWSLGCTVFEMMTGKPPFSEYMDPVSALFHITATNKCPYLPPRFSVILQHFLLLCFERNPNKRPSASKLLQHPFLTTSTWV